MYSQSMFSSTALNALFGMGDMLERDGQFLASDRFGTPVTLENVSALARVYPVYQAITVCVVAFELLTSPGAARRMYEEYIAKVASTEPLAALDQDLWSGSITLEDYRVVAQSRELASAKAERLSNRVALMNEGSDVVVRLNVVHYLHNVMGMTYEDAKSMWDMVATEFVTPDVKGSDAWWHRHVNVPQWAEDYVARHANERDFAA
jgi:hypothetical protein